jgi:hypothetical protein
VHLFSEHTITRCAWAEIYYKAHRAKDHSHARALRCLGPRWLKIIHKIGRIEHRTTQSYTTLIKSNTVPGSSNSKQLTANNLHKKSLENP